MYNIVKIDFEYKKLCYTKIVGGHYGKRKKGAAIQIREGERGHGNMRLQPEPCLPDYEAAQR